MLHIWCVYTFSGMCMCRICYVVEIYYFVKWHTIQACMRLSISNTFTMLIVKVNGLASILNFLVKEKCYVGLVLVDWKQESGIVPSLICYTKILVNNEGQAHVESV